MGWRLEFPHPMIYVLLCCFFSLVLSQPLCIPGNTPSSLLGLPVFVCLSLLYISLYLFSLEE